MESSKNYNIYTHTEVEIICKCRNLIQFFTIYISKSKQKSVQSHQSTRNFFRACARASQTRRFLYNPRNSPIFIVTNNNNNNNNTIRKARNQPWAAEAKPASTMTPLPPLSPPATAPPAIGITGLISTSSTPMSPLLTEPVPFHASRTLFEASNREIGLSSSAALLAPITLSRRPPLCFSSAREPPGRPLL